MGIDRRDYRTNYGDYRSSSYSTRHQKFAPQWVPSKPACYYQPAKSIKETYECYPASERQELLRSICGFWRDDFGMTYKLVFNPHTRSACTSIQTWPDGSYKVYKNIIQLTKTGSIVWVDGSLTYTIDELSMTRNRLRWQCQQPYRYFIWNRVSIEFEDDADEQMPINVVKDFQRSFDPESSLGSTSGGSNEDSASSNASTGEPTIDEVDEGELPRTSSESSGNDPTVKLMWADYSSDEDWFIQTRRLEVRKHLSTASQRAGKASLGTGLLLPGLASRRSKVRFNLSQNSYDSPREVHNDEQDECGSDGGEEQEEPGKRNAESEEDTKDFPSDETDGVPLSSQPESDEEGAVVASFDDKPIADMSPILDTAPTRVVANSPQRETLPMRSRRIFVAMFAVVIVLQTAIVFFEATSASAKLAGDAEM